MSAATILALISEVLGLLPALIDAGMNVAKLIQSIEAVWSEANVPSTDPQFAQVEAGIAAARAKLQARLAELQG